LALNTILKPYRADKETQEATVLASQCVDWTSVRPGWFICCNDRLTNSAGKNKYKFQEHGIGGGSISREDVGNFIYDKLLKVELETSRKCFTVVDK
jgi:hypothetical protein